jgi:aspartate aminotransferase
MVTVAEQVVARQVEAVERALRPFWEAVTPVQRPGARPIVADFMAGNPQEPTLPAFVEALRRWSVPASTDWFAYRMMHEPARQAAASSLTAELGVSIAAEDIFLTRGAGGAIVLALSTVVEPGGEVVFLSPPWFFYEAMILASGATPVRIRLVPPAFDLDVDAIIAALGPRTRAVIINTPHNPTGRIYPAVALERLAEG